MVQARISSCSSPGYSFKIVTSCHPDARRRRTRSTDIRVPLITGLPVRMDESRVMRESGFMENNRISGILYLCSGKVGAGSGRHPE